MRGFLSKEEINNFNLREPKEISLKGYCGYHDDMYILGINEVPSDQFYGYLYALVEDRNLEGSYLPYKIRCPQRIIKWFSMLACPLHFGDQAQITHEGIHPTYKTEHFIFKGLDKVLSEKVISKHISSFEEDNRGVNKDFNQYFKEFDELDEGEGIFLIQYPHGIKLGISKTIRKTASRYNVPWSAQVLALHSLPMDYDSAAKYERLFRRRFKHCQKAGAYSFFFNILITDIVNSFKNQPINMQELW